MDRNLFLTDAKLSPEPANSSDIKTYSLKIESKNLDDEVCSNLYTLEFRELPSHLEISYKIHDKTDTWMLCPNQMLLKESVFSRLKYAEQTYLLGQISQIEHAGNLSQFDKNQLLLKQFLFEKYSIPEPKLTAVFNTIQEVIKFPISRITLGSTQEHLNIYFSESSKEKVVGLYPYHAKKEHVSKTILKALRSEALSDPDFVGRIHVSDLQKIAETVSGKMSEIMLFRLDIQRDSKNPRQLIVKTQYIDHDGSINETQTVLLRRNGKLLIDPLASPPIETDNLDAKEHGG